MSNHSKLYTTIYGILSLIALVIIADFSLPGHVIKDNIVSLQKERQDYYNASGNYHHTYKVVTQNHEFYISQDQTNSNLQNSNIEYAVSRLFNEVNWYRLHNKSSKSFYSLRLISGVVLPLLTIIAIAIRYKFNWNIEILVFILALLLVADLIFLIL